MMQHPDRSRTGFAHTRELPDHTAALILGDRMPFAWVQVDVTMRSGVKVPHCFELGKTAEAHRFARECDAVHTGSACVGQKRLQQEPAWV